MLELVLASLTAAPTVALEGASELETSLCKGTALKELSLLTRLEVII